MIQTDLQNLYAARFLGQEKYRLEVWRRVCRIVLGPILTSSKSVLDLGSGYGEFISSLAIPKRYALDLNPDGAKKLPANIQFLNQKADDPWPLENNSLDTVVSSNFLEHLPSKEAIRRALSEAHRTLRPGGKIILIGPNVKYVPGEYWDFWDHHVPLTDASVAEVLQMLHFKIEQQVAKFLPYSMSQGSTPSLWGVSLYLRSPFLWPYFGKQFLVVASKA